MANYKRYITYKEFLPGDYEVTSKINVISNKVVDRTRKGVPTIHNAEVAIQHAHKSLYDVLRSNEWQYFVTLTFGDFERDDDDYCRNEFAKWRHEMKKNYPSMYYVAVPEYHKRGCIHFHIVVGGLSDTDLGLVDSGRVYHLGRAWLKEDFINAGYQVDFRTGEGLIIYNVTSWKNGWSTVTKIRSSGAVSRYVSKYLTKSNIDPRFYNKKKFYTSRNCSRPTIVKEVLDKCTHSDYDHVTESGTILTYENNKLAYRKYDVDLSQEEVFKLRLMGAIPMNKHDLPFNYLEDEERLFEDNRNEVENLYKKIVALAKKVGIEVEE